MEEYPAPARKAFFSKENLPMLIAIAAAVVIVAVLLIVLIGNSGPKAVAERFVKACVQRDIDKVDKLSAFDFKAYLVDEFGCDDEEEFFEVIGDWLDEDVTSWKDLSKTLRTSVEEELEDEYGKYKLEIEATKVKELSEKKLKEAFKEWRYEDLEDFGFDSEKVKSGAEVTVKVKIKGEDDKETETLTIYLAKIGGSWKVLTSGDSIF